jgi:hypothetical protein
MLNNIAMDVIFAALTPAQVETPRIEVPHGRPETTPAEVQTETPASQPSTE